MTILERDPSAPAAAPRPAPAPPAPLRGPLRSAFGLLGSMRLTVVLLVILALLTWLGTLAQVDNGIYYVQRQYFESWYVLPRLGFLVIPLPGALPVLALLFLNLVVGGLMRMRWAPRNTGILVVHTGIAMLLLAGFVKLEMSYSGNLSLYEGETGNAVSSLYDWELALLRRDGDGVVERTVPGSVVESATGSRRVRVLGEGLPFDVEVHHFFEHCIPMRKGPMFAATAPLIDGVFLATGDRFLLPAKDREQKLAGCYVAVTVRDGGENRQGILWADDLLTVSGPHKPFTFEVAGQTWGLELRHKTWTLPFDLRLDDFQKTDHPGTTMARDFSSWVTVLEPERSPRKVHIYMNEPLRKDGYVFYQTNWGPQQGGGPPFYSTFEVSSNPSDQWPKWASFVVLFGLVVHFIPKLLRYLDREGQRRAREARNA